MLEAYPTSKIRHLLIDHSLAPLALCQWTKDFQANLAKLGGELAAWPPVYFVISMNRTQTGLSTLTLDSVGVSIPVVGSIRNTITFPPD